MISFNFSKTKEKSKVLRDSKLRDDSTKDDDEETDFVTSVHKNHIQGTKKEKKKEELIIPLIGKNEWRKDNLEEQAIKELIGQSKEKIDGKDLPLLLVNQVPEGFEQEDNMDVSLRPEQSTLDDYEKVPIDEFGMAMLRGMGWNKKEGIGLKNKQHIEMLEPQLRPKGLGLGASTSSHATKQVQNSVPNKEDNEQLAWKIGAGAQVQKGQDKGMYGKIEAFDEDNNRVVIKLAISGKMSTVSKFHVLLISESEFKKKSKILNYDQYAEYKEIQDSKEKERRKEKDRYEEEEDEKHKKRAKHSSSKNRDKEKHNGHNSSKYSNNYNSSNSSRNWVRPHLKVKFIDKKFKDGRFYLKKFLVEDVIEADRFILRSESGNSFLEDINSSQLETVIPKETHSAVCILHGRHKGRIGELVERNSKAETAIIKIPDGGVYELSYDDICEFAGDPEDHY